MHSKKGCRICFPSLPDIRYSHWGIDYYRCLHLSSYNLPTEKWRHETSWGMRIGCPTKFFPSDACKLCQWKMAIFKIYPAIIFLLPPAELRGQLWQEDPYVILGKSDAWNRNFSTFPDIFFLSWHRNNGNGKGSHKFYRNSSFHTCSHPPPEDFLEGAIPRSM